MAFVIEKGIDMPPIPGGNRGSRSPRLTPQHYPWEQMEVGDSFIVTNRPVKKISTAAVYAQRRHGMKFACRSVGNGIRVWRTA
jgi:hypothetical protein